ncbi:RHS repeat domain-containing protein [Methylocystis heyeri]|uniref:Teneurin-like YD-shell domain-containing protein n=1 Tax=Methylocystis heyeri TaxID=391905 RepID=A0A6B8KF06_9HYPH|nr:RHS repeat-associated core domain-containing protein [Methylocystis heyeri]QGM44960.1 hypothetical protein H2LOC_004245 [Methylocystis heyeri]
MVHTDHLGRPVLMISTAGAWVWNAIYNPFGAVSYIWSSPAVMDIRFPGQWFQLETGLAYNWHRHYDPSLGRYIQPDPLGLTALMSDGPSVYGYVGGNPLAKVDPRGTQEVGVCVIGGLANPLCDVAIVQTGIEACFVGYELYLSSSRTGSCSCSHRDIYSPGGVSCQTLRELGTCPDRYKGIGNDRASCQKNARENAKEECRGCLGHCHFTSD